MAATRPTVKDALAEIGAHERECAIRYENIEKRLESRARAMNISDAVVMPPQTSAKYPRHCDCCKAWWG